MEEMTIDGLDEIEVENTSIDDIDSENVNLMFLAIDCSGSMYNYTNDMKNSLDDFKDALQNSKEADEILVARADFDDNYHIGGYKAINEFNTAFGANGCTRMYDTIVDGAQKLMEYREFLKNEGMRVKCVFSVFSDGLDNVSTNSFSEAKAAVEKLNNEEITTAFISFGGESTQIAKDLGFRNLLDVGSSASELRKAFNCLSKSVIEASKSVVDTADDDFFKI